MKQQYLILDESGELMDVLEFDSMDQVKAYKLANPQHEVQSTVDLSSLYLLDEDEEY